MIKYEVINDILVVTFNMREYLDIQPKTYEECAEKVSYFKKVIDAIRLNFPTNKQIFIVELLNCYLTDLYSIRFAMNMIQEIHEYTKNERLLQRIIFKNTGAVFQKVYKIVRYLLPSFIDELLEIDTQTLDTETDDQFSEQELAKCIRDT